MGGLNPTRSFRPECLGIGRGILFSHDAAHRALDDERMKFGRLIANRHDLLVGRRSTIGLRLLHAVEYSDGKTLGRGPVEGDYLFTARNEATACRRDNRRIAIDVRLVDGRIGHIDIRDNIGERLGLSFEPLDAVTPSATPASSASVNLNFVFMDIVLWWSKDFSERVPKARERASRGCTRQPRG